MFSPSSRLVDANLNRAAYARFGVPSYWLVDPERPSATALALTETGEYREIVHVSGDEVFDVDLPFSVRFSPAGLAADRRSG